MDQPNPQFILPLVHTLTFNGSFIDPGCDSWTFAWDFDGDMSTDSTDQNPSHVYSEPGTYTVKLTVTDDDGGIGIDEREVIVFNETEAKHDLADYIQTIPDTVFKGNAEQRKNAFAKIFDALDDMIADEEWNGFITSLQNNVRSKADGTIDGISNDDWITNDTEQHHICMKIDDIVAYIETFM
jgi:PKD repeat protein